MPVVIRPLRTLVVACALVALVPTFAYAQRPKHKDTPAPAPAAPAAAPDAPAAKPRQGKPKTFDFTGIDISGQNRSPQLLYFLERANEELERASLERRSFIPEMVRSIEEDKL